MQRLSHANHVATWIFDALRDLPVHAHVSTRHGGVSPEPWRSLNFSIMRGDTPERVRANRLRLAEAIGVDAGDLVHCRQMHGTGVAKVDWDDAGTFKDATDALITDAIGLPLSLLFGDCVPVLLYDPMRHTLGVCHAGWRGTVNGVATATLWALQAAFDTKPADVIACIGPSIGPQSYEVGDEVIALAHARLPNAAALFTDAQGSGHNPRFDLWEADRSQLVAAGVSAQHIEVSGIDTARNTADFFSHRAERGRCGLFSMVAWLDEKGETQ